MMNYCETRAAMARLLWVVIFCVVILPITWSSGLQATRDLGIYGGHEISIEQAPFMAGIYRSTFFSWWYKFNCGGSIVSEKFIVTAAHCVVGYYSIKVRVGSDHLDEGDLKTVHQRITRKDFNKQILYSDICLLKLEESLVFGPKVAPVELPAEWYELAEDTPVTVTGWGRTETSYWAAKNLRQVTIPIRRSCRMENEICAGSESLGTCNGDSGGPLMHNNVLIGIVSHRHQDSCAGAFGTVYVRVASYSEWIKSHLH